MTQHTLVLFTFHYLAARTHASAAEIGTARSVADTVIRTRLGMKQGKCLVSGYDGADAF